MGYFVIICCDYGIGIGEGWDMIGNLYVVGMCFGDDSWDLFWVYGVVDFDLVEVVFGIGLDGGNCFFFVGYQNIVIGIEWVVVFDEVGLEQVWICDMIGLDICFQFVENIIVIVYIVDIGDIGCDIQESICFVYMFVYVE